MLKQLTDQFGFNLLFHQYRGGNIGRSGNVPYKLETRLGEFAFRFGFFLESCGSGWCAGNWLESFIGRTDGQGTDKSNRTGAD